MLAQGERQICAHSGHSRCIHEYLNVDSRVNRQHVITGGGRPACLGSVWHFCQERVSWPLLMLRIPATQIAF